MNTSEIKPVTPHAFLIFLLSLSAGIAVACIYYSQPILPLLSHDLSVDAKNTAFIPTLTQLGYASGIFFLLPLGDKYNRRHLILIKGLLLSFGMLYIGISHTIIPVLAGSFIIGLMATIAQDIVPIASIIAPDKKQGQYVGKVMTGLLLGILLSRTISGVLSEQIGWNNLFILISFVIIIITITLWLKLPDFNGDRSLPYYELISSLKSLWQQHASLRTAVYTQGILSVAFSAFWSTLALFLADSYHFGSTITGLFGIAGAAGALAAPVAGTLADKYGSSKVIQSGSLLMIISFALMFALPFTGFTTQMIIIALAAIGLIQDFRHA